MRRIHLLPFQLLSLVFLICFTACAVNTASTSGEVENTSKHPEPQNSVLAVSSSENTSSVNQESWYFTENDTPAVRLKSINLVAYYDKPTTEPFVSKFDLTPTSEEFPGEPIGTTEPFTNEFDWMDYQSRLEQAHYRLRINESLKPIRNLIVTRILMMDDVIPIGYEYSVLPPLTWVNEEILENFIEEQVEITYFDGSEVSKYADDSEHQAPVWRVYQGGCFAGEGEDFPGGTCKRHEFFIWLVDFSGDELSVYDMRQIEEDGCGRQFSEEYK